MTELDPRPRERLFRHGPAPLSDLELLTLVLRNGRAGQSAVELARDLLRRHRDIRSLAAASVTTLSDYSGMGPAKAAAVVAAFELGRRSVAIDECVPIRRAEDVVAVARREMRGVRRDELLVFVTDVARRVRWTVSLGGGVGGGSVVRLAPPVGRAIDAVRAHAGAGFAVARITSGPSATVERFDEEVVRRLRAAAVYADLEFHDYVVVADVDWCGVRAPVPYDPPSGRPITTIEARAGPY